MDVDAYLARLGNPDTGLAELHRAHLMAVPFENLDIHAGRPIELDETRIFAKVVGRRRGGFCYELNGLFAALLRELGFDVTLLSARVVTAEGNLNPEFDHLTLRVDSADGPWLADVGFGDAFFAPLRLEPGAVQARTAAEYRLDEGETGWTMSQRLPGEAWRERYRFSLIPREFSDFSGMCRFHQTSPGSHFTQGRICSRRTDDGMVTLTDDRLILSTGGERRELPFNGEAPFADHLRDHFGILLTDDG